MGYRSKNTIFLASAPHGDTTTANAAAGLAAGVGTANQPGVTVPGIRGPAQPLVIQPRDVHPWWRLPGGGYITAAPIEVAANASAGAAAGTGAAYQPGVTTPGGTNAAAGAGAGTGAARQPSITVSSNVPATRATGTGTAAPPAGIGTGLFTHVTVTRDYDLADGAAPTGTVYFTPSQWLRNNGVVVPAAQVAAPLDVFGAITIDLVANTDFDTTPTGSYYTVREDIVGQPRRTYTVIIPHNIGSPVDLSGLGGTTGYGTSGYGLGGYGL